jgi:hypothetical protein
VSGWTTLWADLRSNSAVVAVVAGLVVLLLVGWLIARLTRRRGEQAGPARSIRGRAVENVLTLAAAGVATGVAAVANPTGPAGPAGRAVVGRAVTGPGRETLAG